MNINRYIYQKCPSKPLFIVCMGGGGGFRGWQSGIQWGSDRAKERDVEYWRYAIVYLLQYLNILIIKY